MSPLLWNTSALALRKRLIWILLALLLLPMLACCLWLGRQVRQQRLDRALIQDIKRNDTSTAIALLNQGADANAVDKPYTPVTFHSLLADFWNRLKGNKPPKDTKVYPPALMLVYGPVYFNPPDTSILAILNASEDASGSPEFLVNKRAPVQLVRALLAHGAALNTKDRVGNVLIEYACICDDAQTVKVLLQHHVDPNAKEADDSPPLMCTQDYDCARLLLEFGADANARDSSGRTRLMFIENTKLYPLLLEHHANLNAQDDAGQTALIHLFVSPYLDDNHIRTGMHFLLQHGAKVSLKDRKGRSALDYAKGGHANWMAGGFGKGRYGKDFIYPMEEALRKEQATQDPRK